MARGWRSVDLSAKVSVGGVTLQKREVLLWEGRHAARRPSCFDGRSVRSKVSLTTDAGEMVGIG